MKYLIAVLMDNIDGGVWTANVYITKDDGAGSEVQKFEGELNEVCGWLKRLVKNYEVAQCVVLSDV